MKVLIVEDETAAYESLVEILKDIDSSIEVIGNTESVSQTIHLSDGSSFLIFDVIEVETPIIFTTAYDEYAIEAFKLNSVDYLLKPIKSEELERALNKFKKWTQSEVVEYLSRLTQLAPTSRYKDKFLIPIKDKLLPINLREVSYFYTTDKSTHIYLKNGQSYPYAKTLEQIFLSLNPADFYRANKQYIIARESIKDITIWFDNRLLVTLDIDVPERIYVSKNKAADFKVWIVNE
ncbi:LytR/AlgR family response regulator transcription factor [Dysgonomonas sp. ZJ279]|uniref:LytR/AlgR family response regulator transcription factor n=1 Tax=Dysgonomonas sp. ZJ279 TaxID=2709796 RepID=UPI0013ED1530|nr:LytTR family DNA-binding domain-containing protein [Dysgonomonas sp. ZJ279]